MIELLNIDNMEYMAGCEDNAFDLAIVDPPYGRDGGIKRVGSFDVVQKNGSVKAYPPPIYNKKDWDQAPPFEYFEELLRVSRHQIIWGINYYDISLPGGRVIWDKVNDGSYQSNCEIAYCSLTDRVDMLRYMWRGMMQGKSTVSGTVQQGNKALNEKRIHPTQKPVALYLWLLRKYATKDMRILDTHLGSASSAIAAHLFGCDFVGCEIDSEYYTDSLKRFDDTTRQLLLTLEG